jgi:hypothetical protein
MASPQTFSDNYEMNTDAHFRLWGLKLSLAIQACGLVMTADAGQINWATVTVAAASTSAGYEIYRFNDALQATAPVFIRFDYGTGMYGQAGFWFTVGSGSNGAGTITGNPVASDKGEHYANGSNATIVSGGTSWIAICLGTVIQYSYTIVILIERTHDGAGADTAEGVMVVSRLGTVQAQWLWLPASGRAQTETNFGVMMPQIGGSSSGSYVAIYPFFISKGIYCFPMMGALIGSSTNFTAGVTFALTYYGASHTYIPIATALGITVPRGANPMLLLRYE